MTETTSAVEATKSAGMTAAEGDEQLESEHETTEEGRYIPYGGGSMGWFENSGVLNCEAGNNYLFYTAMQSDRVRSKQFERWGERFNRRGDRRRYKRMTGVSITQGRHTVRGTTRDISRHGVRMQFLEQVELTKGDMVQVTLYEDEQSQSAMHESPAKVVWFERVGKIRPVWNVGLTFENLTEDQQASLQPLLRD
ncbi:MAG TPA: PilZ domain-containing protein [bacterium]|nr:PilZ domain-containing protein [bacterium]